MKKVLELLHIFLPLPFKIYFFIELYLIYNVVLITAVQQSDSLIYIYVYIYTHILFFFLAVPCSMQDLSSPTRD